MKRKNHQRDIKLGIKSMKPKSPNQPKETNWAIILAPREKTSEKKKQNAPHGAGSLRDGGFGEREGAETLKTRGIRSGKKMPCEALARSDGTRPVRRNDAMRNRHQLASRSQRTITYTLLRIQAPSNMALHIHCSSPHAHPQAHT